MFNNLLIILAASLVVIALFRRINLPPVLGYLCVGLISGPAAFGWIDKLGHDANLLGEMGVVFLLFSLGLEFSLPRMLALRKTVFGLGSLQVIACSLPLAGLFYALGVPPSTAFLLGAGLSLSSTAIVSKELTSLGEIFSPHGQKAIGVLLFQDLVAVLLLTLVPVFAGQGDSQGIARRAIEPGVGEQLAIGEPQILVAVGKHQQADRLQQGDGDAAAKDQRHRHQQRQQPQDDAAGPHRYLPCSTRFSQSFSNCSR